MPDAPDVLPPVEEIQKTPQAKGKPKFADLRYANVNIELSSVPVLVYPTQRQVLIRILLFCGKNEMISPRGES